MKFEFSNQIFEKVSSTKFRQSPSSGSRVVTCGQTDMTKVIVALHYFVNAPKNVYDVTLIECSSLQHTTRRDSFCLLTADGTEHAV